MDKRHCRRAVAVRVSSRLQQPLPMPRPENKPDLGVEDAEKPRPGESSKTAELVKIAISLALKARAAAKAMANARALEHGLESAGSRGVIVPRDLKSRVQQRIANRMTQADVFASGGKGIKPRAIRAREMREAVKARPVDIAGRETQQMAGGYGRQVAAMNRKFDENLARRSSMANAKTIGRPGAAVAGPDLTPAGIAPPPLPGVNVVTPTAAPVPRPMSPPPRSSFDAGKTHAGGVAPAAEVADVTRLPTGQRAPQPMTPERAAQLRAATPQAFSPPPAQAPAQAPQTPARPTLGRQALILGATLPAGALAASMANRPVAQQQPQAWQ